MSESVAGAQDGPGSAAAHNALAMQAMRAGDPVRARAVLERAVVEHQLDLAMWLNLAGACRALGDVPAAFNAIEGALGVDPRSFLALLMKASLLERQGSLREAGFAYGVALTQAPDPEALDPPTRRALEHARAAHADYQEGLRRELLHAVSDARGLGGRRRAGASAPLSII